MGKGTRVAVIDDERFKAETVAGIVEEAELVPVIISENDGPFQTVAQLLERIRSDHCAAVICDHRLAGTPFASFTGAALMAALYRAQIPGVLLSTFADMDSDTTIRRYRAQIPCLVRRSNLEPDSLLQGLRLCADEFNGRVVPERCPRRTLVRVVGVSPGPVHDGMVVEAIMHSWDPDRCVRFPLELVENPQIQQALREDFRGEMRLFAQVNVDCQDSMDLFFQDFELAPEPHDDYLTA